MIHLHSWHLRNCMYLQQIIRTHLTETFFRLSFFNVSFFLVLCVCAFFSLLFLLSLSFLKIFYLSISAPLIWFLFVNRQLWNWCSTRTFHRKTHKKHQIQSQKHFPMKISGPQFIQRFVLYISPTGFEYMYMSFYLSLTIQLSTILLSNKLTHESY